MTPNIIYTRNQSGKYIFKISLFYIQDIVRVQKNNNSDDAIVWRNLLCI